MTAHSGVAAIRAVLDTLPGAVGTPWTPPRGREPLSILYKLHGKLFAVLTLRGELYVVLKAEPFLVEILREHYAGIVKRTHLDPRHWVAATFDSDVPLDEIERLARGSHALVRAALPKRRRDAVPAGEGAAPVGVS